MKPTCVTSGHWLFSPVYYDIVLKSHNIATLFWKNSMTFSHVIKFSVNKVNFILKISDYYGVLRPQSFGEQHWTLTKTESQSDEWLYNEQCRFRTESLQRENKATTWLTCCDGDVCKSICNKTQTTNVCFWNAFMLVMPVELIYLFFFFFGFNH